MTIIKNLGLQDYRKTFEQMLAFTEQRKQNPCEDEVWLLEHSPVFTLGTSASDTVRTDIKNIPLVKTNRGGDITYHGPGQVIGYLLINLRQAQLTLHNLVAKIDQLLLSVLASFNISAQTSTKNPGIYVDGKKIASYGLKISNGCSYHGFSLNVDMDLTPFNFINPCGIKDIEMANMSDYAKLNMAEVIAVCEREVKNIL